MTCSSQSCLGSIPPSVKPKENYTVLESLPLKAGQIHCWDLFPWQIFIPRRFPQISDNKVKLYRTTTCRASETLWLQYLATLEMLQQATIHFGSVKKKIFLCIKSSLSNWGPHTQQWDLQKNTQNFVSWAVVSFQTIQQCVCITLPEIHISIYNWWCTFQLGI